MAGGPHSNGGLEAASRTQRRSSLVLIASGPQIVPLAPKHARMWSYKQRDQLSAKDSAPTILHEGHEQRTKSSWPGGVASYRGPISRTGAGSQLNSGAEIFTGK